MWIITQRKYCISLSPQAANINQQNTWAQAPMNKQQQTKVSGNETSIKLRYTVLYVHGNNDNKNNSGIIGDFKTET